MSPLTGNQVRNKVNFQFWPNCSFPNNPSTLFLNRETHQNLDLQTAADRRAREPAVRALTQARARPGRSIRFHFVVTPCYFLLLCPRGQKKQKQKLVGRRRRRLLFHVPSNKCFLAPPFCQRVLPSTSSTKKTQPGSSSAFVRKKMLRR